MNPFAGNFNSKSDSCQDSFHKGCKKETPTKSLEADLKKVFRQAIETNALLGVPRTGQRADTFRQASTREESESRTKQAMPGVEIGMP
jgi:hypothetical protein